MLVQVTPKDNAQNLINSRGFCFVSAITPEIKSDIWVPEAQAKKLLSAKSSRMRYWADVNQTDKGYRVKKLWCDLDEAINQVRTTKDKKFLRAVAAIDNLTELKYLQYQHEYDLININWFDELSDEKQRQLEWRMRNLDKKSNVFDKYNTKVYTEAEYVVEQWALAHKLPFIDYNETNQFAPQDCRIAEVDIDVKAAIGIGRRLGMQYTSKRESREIIIGVSSYINNINDCYPSYILDGVFDPANYSRLKHPLKHVSLEHRYLNVCYFMPMFNYFKSDQLPSLDLQISDDEVVANEIIDYAIYHGCLGDLLQICSLEQRCDLLQKKLSPSNQSLLSVILDLLDKKKLPLLVHYLLEMILSQTKQKRPIDGDNIRQVVYAIYEPTERQKDYIDNLIKGNEALFKVCCHWHAEENAQAMGVDIYQGFIPTLKAVCSQNPIKKTTFFTYSWKTLETLIYESDEQICDTEDCGCLLHSYDDYHIGNIKLGKSSCNKYGRIQYDTQVNHAKTAKNNY